MNSNQVLLGNQPFLDPKEKVAGDFVKINDETFFRIHNYDRMPDFFMTIVSHSDHWMYISSNGALTAGRKNRENALFPYYTVDKIHESRGKTGSKTVCLVKKDGKRFLWEPFSELAGRIYHIERNLYKSIYANKLIFEETNHDLGLKFSYGWYNSERFGWVKRSELHNLTPSVVKVRVLDGIQNILPYGINYIFQNEYSNLADAYKKNELLEDTGLGLFMLSSIPIDRAEPSEALKTTTVWSCGLEENLSYLISNHQLKDFLNDLKVKTETDIRASKGSYYLVSESMIEPGNHRKWYFAAEINQDSSAVFDLNALLKDEADLAGLIEKDIRAGTRALVRITASSDGLQKSAEKNNAVRHYMNVLFNVMRGGIFQDDYQLEKKDFLLYIQQHNIQVLADHRENMMQWPDYFNLSDLLSWSADSGDPDLQRISLEYLPLTFSRRHGDPSRPWNIFSIELKNEDGSPKRHYEGNWRDIFQNWEALSLSFPGFLPGMITKFLNASTADGYNPYRVTREGIDWEIPSPDDPWAYIGYWGDHQIIYLQKFLEWLNAFSPGKLEEFFKEDLFVYANVPYRIKPFEEMIEDPKNTIVFEHDLNEKLLEATKQKGADGKLLTDPSGKPVRANLTEKLLVTLLAKMSNFIPEAGIWLNTQRPEWNDANNALVGNGVSMVTLYYMRRFVVFLNQLLLKNAHLDVQIAEEIESMLNEIFQVLKSNQNALPGGFDDERRFAFISRIGKAGSEYREKIYNSGFSGQRKTVSASQLTDFLQLSLSYIEQSIDKNKRPDGLYHAYNLIRFKGDKLPIRYLYEMLEGQVSVLSSGYLDAAESLKVMDSLKGSSMFRPDQYSYLLYPDRSLPRFTEKNNIPEREVMDSELLQKLLMDENNSIIKKDSLAGYHFHGSFRNADLLKLALDDLDKEQYGTMVEREKEKILEIYENLFDHQSFTGRSGTFFGYEGLGSIYWHMVSKLLLAVQESYFNGIDEGADPHVLNRIREHYYEIKAGIGLYKSPDLYGAFPTDAYSHSPANAGVKQPGLTGQVKEDVISRLRELGLHIVNGCIAFEPALLNHDEFLKKESEFEFVNLDGRQFTIPLREDQLAYSFCQVPVIYTKADKSNVVVEMDSGQQEYIEGHTLPVGLSQEIFNRTGRVKSIRFDVVIS